MINQDGMNPMNDVLLESINQGRTAEEIVMRNNGGMNQMTNAS